jgi:hypothetical protein
MREQVKRPDDDLPAVHLPLLPMADVGRNPDLPHAGAMVADVGALARRLTDRQSEAARKRLFAAIQRRFGNGFAARVAAAAEADAAQRLLEDES